MQVQVLLKNVTVDDAGAYLSHSICKSHSDNNLFIWSQGSNTNYMKWLCKKLASFFKAQQLIERE
jgi:hypothetical protein